jgi:hypothetical protein
MNTAPIAEKGRDLRMTLEIRATTPGDRFLAPLIEKAVDLNGCGDMYVGKRVEIEDGDTRVELTMTEYQQTWDGDCKP